MRETGSRLPQRLGALATQALIAEASLSPKPGLVTPLSKGAHADMDYRLFLSSALALEPCFQACGRAGERAGLQADALAHTGGRRLLERLRVIGKEGERAMFRATGGVNTHKGAIFCLGLLCTALAFVRSRKSNPGNDGHLGDAACEWVAGLCSGLVERELSSALCREPVTAGERLFRDYGVRGARGQAQDGYPLLKSRILPGLRVGLDPSSDGFAHACLDALTLSMSELEDSCLLSRGGAAGLEFVRSGATWVQKAGSTKCESGRKARQELDAALCARGLSPGGSADMLAGGIFLALAERHFKSSQAAGMLASSIEQIA